jgi:protein ImuB
VHRGTALVLRTRPERIEAGWFDDEPVCRDYYVAEDTDHRLCWIYREHRAQAQGWFLHGWFN